MSRGKAILFGVLAIAGAIFLTQLGFWQLHRLAWKEALIEQMQRAIAGEGEALALAPIAARFSEDVWADYLPVEVSGRYVGETQWLYAVVDGRPGWKAVDLLQPDQGKAVLIDRGAVPDAARGQILRPQGQVVIRGFARRPQEQAGAFQPESAPERREYFWRDHVAMAGNVAAYGFVIEKLPDAQDLALPKPELPDPKAMPNNHLDYALTWFSLAGLLLLLTGYFLWTGRKARENHPHA